MVYRGKTKVITNNGKTDNVQIDGTEIEKATNYEYLEQTTAMENRTEQEVSIRIMQDGVFFWKVQRNLSGQALSHESKKKNGLKSVCPTSSDLWMLNMVSYKSISKEA